MPNWCDNTITVTGYAKAIKEFDNKFKGAHYNFNGGCSNCRKEDFNEKDYEEYVAYRVSPYSNMFATEEEKINRLDINYISKKEVVEGYSFSCIVPCTDDDFLSGWYEWHNKNWGTKWDISDNNLCVSGIDLVDEAIADNELDSEIDVVYSFDTAWGPCEPVVKAMSKQFPDLKFIHEYREDGNGFAGVVTYEDGACIENLESSDYDLREFLVEHFDEEYYKCTKCGNLISEDEFEDEFENGCSKCGCKEVFDYDGTTKLVKEGAM